MGHEMNGHVRPSLAIIRVWFLIVGVMILVSAMTMYDLDLSSMTYDAHSAAMSLSSN